LPTQKRKKSAITKKSKMSVNIKKTYEKKSPKNTTKRFLSYFEKKLNKKGAKNVFVFSIRFLTKKCALIKMQIATTMVEII